MAESTDRERATSPTPPPLIKVTRGSITESLHRGHIVATDYRGNILSSLGNPEAVTFLRSSAKPLQAIPLVVSGAADHFGFGEEDVALACGSHSGEAVHTQIAARMLKKVGLEIESLRCGTHEPFSKEAAQALCEKGLRPTPLHNNCSGKHVAMLALASYLDTPLDTYDQPNHPVQLEILRTLARFAQLLAADIEVGIDGCGVPTFGMPLRAMAQMYARIMEPPVDFEPDVRDACVRIASSMSSRPELVGGTKGRFDTDLMRATKGRLISKVGAEGVYTAGIAPCSEWPQGFGLAIKIEDGENHRSRPSAAVESLRQLGVLRGVALHAVSGYLSSEIRNHRGDLVGEIRPGFQLTRH